jgi:ABC-2 type transport system ATP-binding protein
MEDVMDTILKTNALVKKYGQTTVLNNINMTINRGDIYGFVGKNGAGKTTFMRTVLSLTNPTSGEIKLFGDKSIEEVGLRVGSLIEAPGLYKNATAYENLKRFSILYGANEDKIQEILELVGLGNTGKKKAKDFSLGMRQRLGIAIALLGEPELLLLDEPINGLDPAGIKDIRDLILKLNKERNITFLISSHLLDELAKVVTKYGFINNGNLFEEIEAKKLLEKCKQQVIIEVDDTKKALSILETMIDKKSISTKDNTVIIDANEDTAFINTKLVKGGVSVSSIYSNSISLEDYFMERIGA